MNKIDYNLPFEDYLKAPGVSKSLLDEFRVCPLQAYEVANGLAHKKRTHAMLMGSLVDLSIFTPSDYPKTFHLQPSDYTNDEGEAKPWSNNAKVCKAWNMAHSNLPIIDQKEVESIERMRNAVWAEPQAAELLKQCDFQVSLFADHPRTGLPLKGRPDGVAEGFLVDLKKTSDASTDGFSKIITDRKYYVQAAYYTMLAEANGLNVPDFYFIAVEEGERPRVNVRRLELEAIALGRVVYEMLLARYAECVKSGVWPGYCQPGSVGTISVKPWEESNVMDSVPLLNVEEAA